MSEEENRVMKEVFKEALDYVIILEQKVKSLEIRVSNVEKEIWETRKPLIEGLIKEIQKLTGFVQGIFYAMKDRSKKSDKLEAGESR